MGTAVELGHRTVGVVSLSRTFMRTGTHHAGAGAPNVTAGGMAKLATESAGKIRVVAKAAGMGNHAEWLFSSGRKAALDKTRGMIKPHRTNEMTAGGAAQRE